MTVSRVMEIFGRYHDDKSFEVLKSVDVVTLVFSMVPSFLHLPHAFAGYFAILDCFQLCDGERLDGQVCKI